MAKTVDIREINKFSEQSRHWWDESGPFKPLHQMNPVRVKFIRDTIIRHYGIKKNSLSGIHILDVGAGGGILCEPLSRLGANVTGMDASGEAIEIAKAHASTQGLDINYVNTSLECSDFSQKFDVVCVMEIVEHVAELDRFIALAAKLINSGGLLFFSTINRTFKSLMFAKIAAEYVLRLVPQGTHDWKKFVKPSELDQYLRLHDIEIKSLEGITLNPLKRDWIITPDLSVNYMGYGVKF